MPYFSKFLTAVVFLAALPGCGRGGKASMHGQVVGLIRAGREQEAVEVLDEALAKDPQNKDLLSERLLVCVSLPEKPSADELQRLWKDLQAAGGDDFCLHKSVEHNEPTIQRRTAYVLGVLQNDWGRHSLERLTGDRDVGVRTEATLALGKYRCGKDRDLFLILLKDIAWPVRAEAAVALGRLGDATVSANLLMASNDPDGYARSEIRGAALTLADASQAGVYLAHLNGSDWQRQVAAALALGKIGRAEAVPMLMNLLWDKNFDDRGAAAEGLTRIAPAVAAKLYEKLLPQEQDDRVRTAILDYFRARNDSQSERVLQEYGGTLKTGA